MSDEPPFLVPPPPRTASIALRIAVTAVGLLQLALAITASQLGSQANQPVSAQIGFVIGASAIWPLIVVGLFSIGKRFRDPRSRMIIILSVWGFS